jgi:hypothetical protein
MGAGESRGKGRGRNLSKDEARYVTEMVRRIIAILLMEPRLKANYKVVRDGTYPWPSATR